MEDVILACVAMSAGILLVGMRVWMGRRGGQPLARRMYTGEQFAYFVRVMPATAGVLGLSIAAMGIALLLPRQIGAGLFLLGSYAGVVAFVASYRVPQPLIPRWLRDEIQAGIVPVTRPDWWDWVLCWVLVALLLAAPFGVPLLLSSVPG
jgi:hypothetical protein